MSLFLIIAVSCLFIAFTSGPMSSGYLFFLTGIVSFLIWAFLFIFGKYGKSDDKKASSKGKSKPALTRSPVQVEFVVSDADTGQQVSSGSIGLAIKSQSAKQALADYEKKPTDLNFKRLFEAAVVGDDPSQPGDAYAMVFSVLSKLGWGKLDAEDVTAELVSYSISGTSRKISDVVSDWCKLQLVKDGRYMYVYESWSGEVSQRSPEVAPESASKKSTVSNSEQDRLDRVSESWTTNKPKAQTSSAKPAPAVTAKREVAAGASIPYDNADSGDIRNHGAATCQLVEKLTANRLLELELGEESSFGNFPTRLLCTNYEQRLDPTDNDSRIQKRSVAVKFFGLDSPVKVTAEIIRNTDGIVASKITWTDALGKNSPEDHPDWTSIKENLGLVDEVVASSAVAQPSAEIKSSEIDFGTFAEDLVNQVKWAAGKEDESYAGEVFKEKVNGFLEEAGIDIESKFSFEAGYGDWIAAPDDVLIELITAIRETEPFLNGECETDAGVARIQAEIEDCLANNTQINEKLTIKESESKTMTKLIWHIDRAKFAFEDADDYESWKKNPEIYFEFSPSSADEDASHLFEDVWALEFYEKVVEPPSKLSITLEDDGPLISAWVAFSAETTEDFEQDSFDEWSSDGGGWYTGSISLGDFDAHITGDDGGDLRIG